jgi:putative transposase
MTKVFVEGEGWTYITVVLDWYTKKIVGLKSGRRFKSADWLEALDQALNAQFPNGARGRGLKLVSDNGCQPNSGAYMRYCLEVDVEQIYTSYNNPKGNAETERFMRTMKEELLWLMNGNPQRNCLRSCGVGL